MEYKIKTIVSADRVCDLNKDLLNIYNIRTIPYSIELNGNHYYDNVDITLDDILKLTRSTRRYPRLPQSMLGIYGIFKPLVEGFSGEREILYFGLGNMSVKCKILFHQSKIFKFPYSAVLILEISFFIKFHRQLIVQR